jgi:hypothetical protein
MEVRNGPQVRKAKDRTTHLAALVPVIGDPMCLQRCHRPAIWVIADVIRRFTPTMSDCVLLDRRTQPDGLLTCPGRVDLPDKLCIWRAFDEGFEDALAHSRAADVSIAHEENILFVRHSSGLGSSSSEKAAICAV